MKTNRLTSKRSFRLVKALYLVLGVVLVVPIFLILFTNGSIKQFLVEYWYYVLLLGLLPIYFSLIGMYHFFFSDDQYVVAIQSKCIALGEYSADFNHRIELPRDHIIAYELEKSLFGLKKMMLVKFKVNGVKKAQKFNVSMLNKREYAKLVKYMDSIVNAND